MERVDCENGMLRGALTRDMRTCGCGCGVNHVCVCMSICVYAFMACVYANTFDRRLINK